MSILFVPYQTGPGAGRAAGRGLPAAAPGSAPAVRTAYGTCLALHVAMLLDLFWHDCCRCSPVQMPPVPCSHRVTTAGCSTWKFCVCCCAGTGRPCQGSRRAGARHDASSAPGVARTALAAHLSAHWHGTVVVSTAMHHGACSARTLQVADRHACPCTISCPCFPAAPCPRCCRPALPLTPGLPPPRR
jgi:hypothetical protein